MDVQVAYTLCTDPVTLNITAVSDDGLSNHDRLLQCLNDEKAALYIPVIVFLVVLIITGTFGNVLVCWVYLRKSYKASSHYFILSLAILDLFSCVIGLPTEIADLRYPYMFDMPVACKILRFSHSSTIIASSTILIQVAFDRYFRICKLGQQFSVQKAKCLCTMAILLGVLTSWPSCLLFGRKTVNLHVQYQEEEEEHAGLHSAHYRPAQLRHGPRFNFQRGVRHETLVASDCSTDDSMRGTIYPTIYYLFLFSLFFLTIAFFAVLYTRIGVAIWRRKRKTIGSKILTKANSQQSDQTSTEVSSEAEGTGDSQKNRHHPPILTTGTLPRGAASKGSPKTKEPEPEVMLHNKKTQIRVGKTTTVLFAVTLAYILSFLPYLVVMILRSTIKDFEGRLSPVGEVAYKFCVKSFFINNAINPLIYSFLNAGFRKDARLTLRKMFHNCFCRCICCGACCCGDTEDELEVPPTPVAV